MHITNITIETSRTEGIKYIESLIEENSPSSSYR